MQPVLLTALGVGGATVFGAVVGFMFKKISHRFSDIVLAFAAGVMLAAAVTGLILPSVELGGKYGVIISCGGIFCGAFIVNILDKLVPHLHKLTGDDSEKHKQSHKSIDRILLFVLAVAIHNFPEGIAAGVGFGTGDVSEAFTIAFGIALQNIPEGMVIISPMLSVGISRTKTMIIAVLTGVVEVAGTFLGYFAVSICSAILPFALAFAGGTMLYVISDEMIPDTHEYGSENGATYSLLTGFCLMLAMNHYV